MSARDPETGGFVEADEQPEERKSCRNCRFWKLEHGYMDCGAPDTTAWDADGNCDGWQEGPS